MKKSLLFIVVALVTIASCVKDRIPPVPKPVVVSASDTLMYYWGFNTQDTTNHKADFSVHGTSAYFQYDASYIDYTVGSKVNLVSGTDSGECLRVRNPSYSLVFVMPTTGYDSIVLGFSERASSTSSGSTINSISYTTDGVNYITTALTSSGGTNQYNVDTAFTLQTFNFSSDPNVNNNPNFAVMIQFVNNHLGASGNDRFDNVTLMGVRQ